jgi:hypothetical protein
MFSLPNRKTLPALLALMLLVLTIVSCKNFFVDAKLTSIAVNPSTASLSIAGTSQLLATGTYDDSSTKDVTQSVTWTVTGSNPTGAASVGNTAGTKGLVTGNLAGTATIQASAGGATSGTATVTVGLTLTKITVTPANDTITKSTTGTLQYTATGTYSDGSSLDITSAVTWTASTTDVTFSTTSIGLAQIQSIPATNPITITATSTPATGSIVGNTTLTIN